MGSSYSAAVLRISLIILALTGISGCVSFAPPSPLMTYGGPATVEKSHSEVGLAVGTGFALFPGGHGGGQGWFGRYKRGLSDDFDLGIDAVGVVRSDKGSLLAKLAGRYRLSNNFRLEGALGAGDDSDGKSLNGDIALTAGTVKQKTWNYYASLRLGAAKGYPGSVFGSGDQAPVDALFPILNLGAQAKVTENQSFIIEGGLGYVIPRDQRAGNLLYISCGILFDLAD